MAVRLCSALTVLYLLIEARVQDACQPDIILPHHTVSMVCAGRPFNLSCIFECLSVSYRRQLWHDKQLLLNLSVTTRNSTLHYHVPKASSQHGGTYSCQTEPRDAMSPEMPIFINGTCEVETVKTEPYLLVVWYLLCKAGAFLLLITITLLPYCRAH